MKKFFSFILCFLTIFFCAGCGENKKEISYTLIEVEVGRTFDIELKSYSGTAYRWEYEVKPNEGIEFITSEFIPENDDPDWVGGGKIVYTFKTVDSGEFKIKFFAKNISKPNDSPTETKAYKIKVINEN